MSVLTVEDFQGNIKESTSKSFKVGNNYFAAEAIKVGTRSDGSNKYNYNLIRYDGPDLTGETKIGFLNPNTNKLDFFPTVQNIVNTHNLKPIKGLIDKNFKNSIKTLDVTDKDQNENEATSVESESTTVADVKKPAVVKARQSYETDLCYPVTLRRGSQDRLQIDVRQLQKRRLRDAQSLTVSDRNLGKSIGRVFLPIPAGIQDFNGVSFQSGSLNPIELAAAQTALTGVTEGLDALTDEVSSLVRGALGTRGRAEDLRKAIATYFVGQATGIGARGIFTRTVNAVVNPNLELLFTGPTLRPFNFTFKMSPRDKGESIVVKKIIRLFKQSSAVQTTPSGLFLKSPDAYTIKYLTKGSRSIGSATTPEGLDSFDDTHDFLPKIKNCALLNCSVNYTPDGSYMTYENTSPVSYTMTLRFQELEPIFNDDYTNLDGDSDDSVGF
tara:strand:+ start:308 stop:1630 length:1323 start_codon:yes stop_codon:yes gene_type:complete